MFEKGVNKPHIYKVTPGMWTCIFFVRGKGMKYWAQGLGYSPELAFQDCMGLG